MNLRIQPDDSYLFDGLTPQEADSWLNNVTFYSEVTYNIPLQNFLNERMLSEAFVPVATFHKEEANSQMAEFVALVEGAHFPFFAIAYAPDRNQFNTHMDIDDEIDHGKAAVKMALRFANLFADEARLSGNSFRSARDEYMAMILNYDSQVLDNTRDSRALVNGEMYLFK